ncbi:hypothetical protein NSQ82_01425 [Caldifermentibacillus hisashii]|uniref:hypothetical protein n=1 Tax=Caldifermentibacillus hisashii TaxID=996558 RepID=UPI0031B68513
MSTNYSFDIAFEANFYGDKTKLVPEMGSRDQIWQREGETCRRERFSIPNLTARERKMSPSPGFSIPNSRH